MKTRMIPFASMVPRLRRIVRQISGELGKKVDFDVRNAEGEMDRNILERMVAPLEHMLRNALDHGIETPEDRTKAGKPATGEVVLSLTREGGDVVLRMMDDGKGIPSDVIRDKAVRQGLMRADEDLSEREILQFILQPGFSTAQQVTQISGRGVGMDVVASEIKQLGGSLDIDSALGRGTTFTVPPGKTSTPSRSTPSKVLSGSAPTSWKSTTSQTPPCTSMPASSIACSTWAACSTATTSPSFRARLCHCRSFWCAARSSPWLCRWTS